MLKPVPFVHDEPSETARKGSFWELIGLRVQGLEDVLIGAVEFQRQSKDSAARRALSHYLSSPPSGLDLTAADYPSHLLKVAVRPPHHGLKDFLSALNRGEAPKIVLIDLEMVQLCFDFRRANPSLDRERFRDQSESRMCLRTIDGHVVTGVLHSPLQRLRRHDRFLGVTEVIQRTALADLSMPDLIVHRRFFSAVTACSEERVPTALFEPSADSSQPLIGVAAWRFFMARRTGDDRQQADPVDLAAAS